MKVPYDALHAVFDSPQGAEVLAWLKGITSYGVARVIPGDPYLTHVAIGEQNIGNQIVAALALPRELWDRPTVREPDETDWLFQKGNKDGSTESPR